MRGKGWSRLLLVDYFGWAVILSGASVEICQEWVHWESRVGCVVS